MQKPTKKKPQVEIEENNNKEYGNQIKQFREFLGLTQRGFGIIMGRSSNTVCEIERGNKNGHNILKRIEMFQLFPDAAIFFIMSLSSSKGLSKNECVSVVTKLRNFTLANTSTRKIEAVCEEIMDKIRHVLDKEENESKKHACFNYLVGYLNSLDYGAWAQANKKITRE